jgi:outer membrane protein assembly factor BamD (BamD/ComL family)
MKLKYFLLLLVLCVLLACKTKAETIPEDLPKETYFKIGNELKNKNKYKEAIEYFEIVIDRFPDDMEIVLNAQYEIALIHYKMKEYKTALLLFDELIEAYNAPDAAYFPRSFLVLAQKIKFKITTILEDKKRRNKEISDQETEP